MDSTVVQQPVYVFNRENDARKGPYAMNVALPATPVYSRPGSSCSQPPTLYSNGPSVMTPVASPPTSHKASMLVEADVYDINQFPSTPPLSASGSTVGSPKASEALQMPLNPMFSGLDGFFPSKDMFDSVEPSILDWSGAGSPPMTPVYMQGAQNPHVNEILSATSCPSLSPSPTPYARSIASDQGADFCDPRNLTVSAGSNPTLSAELCLSSLGEEDVKSDQTISQPAFAFNPALHGLPGFEEFSDSEEDFCNLVNLGDVSAETRPRACTGSSIVSLGHGSFIGDDDITFDSDAFAFPSMPSPACSSEDCHKDKKQKKTHKKEKPVVNAAANTVQSTKSQSQAVAAASPVDSESPSSPGSEDSGSAMPPAPSRRGRKQSLTEDPSKTFVCDLCNRRFRRQEHLKRHYRSLHTQEKPFECNECGKKFSRSDNLAQHARTHSSGAIVMGVLEEGEQHPYDGSMIPAPNGDDYNAYGKVLFQIASEIPGSASELSSEEAGDQGRKKRKRSD